MVNLALSGQTVPNDCLRLAMAINTRLTEAFKLAHPVVLAPMGVAASGRLAAAVAAAGGLGLIGVGYRDKTGSSLKATRPAMFVWGRFHYLAASDVA